MGVQAWLRILVLLGDIQTAAQETVFYKYGEIPANDTAIFPATSIKKNQLLRSWSPPAHGTFTAVLGLISRLFFAALMARLFLRPP